MGAAENTSVYGASRDYPTRRLAALSQFMKEAPGADDPRVLVGEVIGWLAGFVGEGHVPAFTEGLSEMG